MIPSKNLRRSGMMKTFEYIEPDYGILDTSNFSDLGEYYTFGVNGKNKIFDETYVATEFDMAYSPTSLSGRVFPKDLPDQAFMDVCLCETELDVAILCQLKKRYDKYCQKEMMTYLRCRERRDKAIELRSFQYETWKAQQETAAELEDRLKDIEDKRKMSIQRLSLAFKERDIARQRECENDLRFLQKRKHFIENLLK